MKRYKLGEGMTSPYPGLTEDELFAWNCPEPGTYHSFHVERMGADIFRWRDSKTADFYIGTHAELCEELLRIQLRKANPNVRQVTTVVNLLSQDEIDDLLSDL